MFVLGYFQFFVLAQIIYMIDIYDWWYIYDWYIWLMILCVSFFSKFFHLYREVYPDHSQTLKMTSTVNYFGKKFHLWCLADFWKCPWIRWLLFNLFVLRSSFNNLITLHIRWLHELMQFVFLYLKLVAAMLK